MRKVELWVVTVGNQIVAEWNFRGIFFFLEELSFKKLKNFDVLEKLYPRNLMAPMVPESVFEFVITLHYVCVVQAIFMIVSVQKYLRFAQHAGNKNSLW